ncbi:hypothetical protein H6P81_020417 [Aristolochia fimbriata]|uniref:Uncharacterized protein n=1 Tax=Aristolochia fimbriata TaxID=158543 RepID=A0AAV7DXL9_ARIFI|nr:hypothetical protein H6P81_020417 [Aristolochia fimbriata]
MSQARQEEKVRAGEKEGERPLRDEDLPMKTSPYLHTGTVDDYNRKGYGTEEHKEPVDARGGGGTDAPTLSGTGLSDRQERVESLQVMSVHPERNSPSNSHGKRS